MKIQSKLSCLDKNVIYIIECRRCIVQYGGSTEQQYRLRCDQWRSDIRLNKKQSQVIEHFNIKGHALERDFRMIAIEKVFGDRDTLRIRERMYMDKYNLLPIYLVLIHSQTTSDTIQTPSRHPHTPSRHTKTYVFLYHRGHWN